MIKIEYLKNDEELKVLRKKWTENFSNPFPPFNYDEYNSLEDYKETIKKRLKQKTKKK